MRSIGRKVSIVLSVVAVAWACGKQREEPQSGGSEVSAGTDSGVIAYAQWPKDAPSCRSDVDESVSAVVGDTAAVLTLASGTRLILPRDSNRTPSKFTLTRYAGNYVLVRLKPDGKKLPVPGQLIINYGSCGEPQRPYSVYRWQAGKWRPLMRLEAARLADGEAAASLDHLSDYSIGSN